MNVLFILNDEKTFEKFIRLVKSSSRGITNYLLGTQTPPGTGDDVVINQPSEAVEILYELGRVYPEKFNIFHCQGAMLGIRETALSFPELLVDLDTTSILLPFNAFFCFEEIYLLASEDSRYWKRYTRNEGMMNLNDVLGDWDTEDGGFFKALSAAARTEPYMDLTPGNKAARFQPIRDSKSTYRHSTSLGGLIDTFDELAEGFKKVSRRDRQPFKTVRAKLFGAYEPLRLQMFLGHEGGEHKGLDSPSVKSAFELAFTDYSILKYVASALGCQFPENMEVSCTWVGGLFILYFVYDGITMSMHYE